MISAWTTLLAVWRDHLQLTGTKKGREIHRGVPYMCTTEKDKVNQDLLAFIERKEKKRAA
jgi:aerobic-type carbon monoxide dehydrogenase small subunit (CoxS/CutS family)